MSMFISGSPCWVPDETEAFLPGTFVEMKNGKAVVNVNGENREFPEGKLFPRKKFKPVVGAKSFMMKKAVPDMDDLSPLNMAEVLENVAKLFQQAQSANPGDGACRIYSSVGPILIAMNPFEWLKIYDESWIAAYHDAANSPVLLQKLGPHAYRTSEEVLQCLNTARRVAVVICGESGAGKTVTNTKMLRYLCEVSKAPGDSSIGGDPEKISEASSVLEAFGNARTTRNDNSSRFGRFTKLYFDKDRKVAGCGTTSYLLERSRIPGATKEERNYHAFYMLIRGSQASKYQLKSDPAEYVYTKQGTEVAQPGVYAKTDADDFSELIARLKKAGFDDASIDTVFEAIAAVLHLGNVKIQGGADSSSVAPADLAIVAQFLGVDATNFANALTHSTMKVGVEMITRDLKQDDALANRDTVSKMVYNRIFDHVVDRIDSLLKGTGDDSCPTVGLLDIFGFEDMPNNGFEQLFINSTNERIQHLFNTVMFEREKLAYQEEGINADFLKGPNNLLCTHLCLGPDMHDKAKKTSIVALLSDQVMANKPDKDVDGSHLVDKLDRAFGMTNEFYVKMGFKEVNDVLTAKGLKKKGQSTTVDHQECFGIKHFAGLVMYTVKDFVPKSRDTLTGDLTKVLAASTKPTISAIFKTDAEVKDQKSEATVGAKFRRQLSELAATLDAGESRFVRCIKSNTDKVPGVVERKLVLEQLINGGVVDALEIRAKGLPDRRTYKDFIEEFRVITYGSQKGLTEKQSTDQVLSMLPKFYQDPYKCGKTKIFMKTGVVDFLNKVVRVKENHLAGAIQRKLQFNRVMKIEQAWEAVMAARADAEAKRVHKVGKVKQTLDDAEKKIKPIYDALLASKAKHGVGQAQSKGESVAMYVKIENDLASHKDAMQSMRVWAQQASECVEEYYNRKMEVEGEINTLASKAMATALDFERRIKAALAESNDCEAAEKADIDKCLAACSKAKAEVEAFKKEVEGCREKISSALGKVNLEIEPWEVPNPCPELDAKSKAAEALVKEAERLSFEVLAVQRAFKKAFEELDEGLNSSREELDKFNEEAKQCKVQNILDPYEKVMNAYKLNEKLEMIKAASKDAEGFKKTAEEFRQAVAAAGTAVEGARAELARIAKERAERQELTSKLEQMASEIRAAKDGMTKQVNCSIGGADIDTSLNDELHELLEKVNKLQYEVPSDKAEEWKGAVKSLVTSSEGTMGKAAGVIQQLQDASKANFAKIAGKFGGRKSVAVAPEAQSGRSSQFAPPKRDSPAEAVSSPQQPAPASSLAVPVAAAPPLPVASLRFELNRFGPERLGTMKIGELNKMARNLGIGEDERDTAMDSDDQKKAFIEMIQKKQKPAWDEQAARATLGTMRVGELTKLARSLGVNEDDRDAALDDDNQVQAFAALILPLQKAKAEAA